MKRSALFVCLFVGLAFTLVFSLTSPARSATPTWLPAVPETNRPDWTISTHVTWTLANSPYILSERIDISGTGSLTIEPGVVVKSPENSGGFLIQAGGQLIANGTSLLPIYFTAVDPTKPWDDIIVVDGGSLRLTYCDIAYATGNYFNYSNNAALILFGSNVEVRNTRIHDNPTTAVNIASPGLTPLFENVTIDNNSGLAIAQKYITAQPVYHNLNLHDNAGGNFVYIENGNVIDRDVTLDSTGLNGKHIQLGTTISVNQNRTLTILPGTEIRFNPSTGLTVLSSGSLMAQGTLDNPILLTAVDNAHTWNVIMVNAGGSARLDHCDISYAAGDYYHYGDGALYLFGSDVQVRNTRIHHNNNTAGVWIGDAGLTPLFENVTIDNNSGMAIYQKFITAQPVYHNINIHDNAGGDYLVINNANVDQDVTLDTTGLNGKPVVVYTGINLTKTLTITPGSEIRMYPGGGIFVQNGGKLAAEGTAAKPIIFTAVDITKPWTGVYVYTGGSARLDYCDIAYAASDYYSYGDASALKIRTSDVEVRNCRIHDNTTVAIVVNLNSHPLLRNNQIYNNTYGLRNWNANVWVDARFNYWGDPTGPKNTARNPTGLGQEVSDKVFFVPWYEDTLGTLMQKVYIQVVGPTRASPGEKLEYQVLYFAGVALTDAVLSFTLPDTANFISTTPDGAYYPKTGQVYWKLGNLPAQSEGTRTVSAQTMWGLPGNYPDGGVALMGSPSLVLAPYVIDTTPLKEYIPITASSSTILTSSQIDDALLASANLKALYDSARAKGYIRIGGMVLSTSDGNNTTQIALIHANKSLMNVRLDQSSGAAEAVTFTATTFTMTDHDGSVTLDLAGNQVLPTGGWNLNLAGPQTAEYPLLNPLAEISPYLCWRNCMMQAAGMWAIQKLSNTADAAIRAKDCAMALTGDPDAAANCFMALERVTKLVPGVSEIKETTKCTAECANPLKRDLYVCHGTLTTVEPPTWAWLNPVSWIDSGSKRQYVRYNCNTTTNTWSSPEILYCPRGFVAEAGAKDADGKPCVPANDDVAFAYGYPDRKVPSSRSKLTLRAAKDPNAKYGVNGSTQSAVLPGQELTYTITYENEGAGAAYGVYILDTLAAQLDESSLNLNGEGQYYPASRQIAWDIGELAPKGQPGSTGSVTFSITPQAGLPVGTVIVNRAIVYFPSVPEETPTNGVINTIQPLVAIPQEVQATAGLAKAITLQGAGPGTLTFQVVDTPMHGSLTGSAPNFNYSANATFSGTDIFSFQVQSSAGTSLAAQVIITVSPNPAETTPPAVLWSSPSAGSIFPPPNPASFTDAIGTGYFPQIIVQFSEVLDAATVIPANVTLTAGGSPKTASVAFVAGLNQVVIVPRQALPLDTPITVTISTAVKDTQNNALATPYTVIFQLVEANGYNLYLPLIKK